MTVKQNKDKTSTWV